MGRRLPIDARAALVVGCVVIAVSSCAPWFSEHTLVASGDLGGLDHGGLATLLCALVGLVMVFIRPRFVAAVSLVALGSALASAYQLPGVLASSHGGEVVVAWGVLVVIGAAGLTAGIALFAPRTR
ncbi:MAG TPA: hypothetical protein VI318_15715 [Baekduia sp.]